MARPLFSRTWNLFLDVNVDVKSVGEKIGGKVKFNIENRIFTNACPIRMSYVLNYSGTAIPKPGGKYNVVSGADAKWYMYRVAEMMNFLSASFGSPDLTVKKPKIADFANRKGILLIRGSGWSDAVGHVTLFDGKLCSDACHLIGDPLNGSFTPDEASIWLLQ
jgi:hypothetical protein